jgi:hypothetical protein
MALIIETGAGVPGADSYATVAQCEAYALAYYGASLAGSPHTKEAAMRRAAAHMNSLRWRGSKTNGRNQGLAWPRVGMVDCDGSEIGSAEIPPEVIAAQHEFARAEFIAPGVLSPQSSLLDTIRNRAKVDVIEVGYDTSRVLPTVDNLQVIVTAAMRRIECYLVAGGKSVRMTDAVAV